MKIINLVAAIDGGAGIIHLEMLLVNKCICLGTTDLGLLFSKEQQSKGTMLYGNSPAWKRLRSCLEMKDRVCQPGKCLSLRTLQ